ncbi:MAG: hypothetical protein R3F34_05380 [Planctomycetota bacterium]
MIYVLAWLAFVPLAIGNGVLREEVLRDALPELAAHQVSTAMLAVVFGAWAGFVVRRRPPRSPLRVGLLWLLLTVAFEFGFGRAVAGKPWSVLLADYDLTAGRVWGLFLVWVVLAPVVTAERPRAAD